MKLYITIFALAMVVMLVLGCSSNKTHAPSAPAEQVQKAPTTSATAQDQTTDTVSTDILSDEDIGEDLDFSDLDGLDSDLQALENLDI